MTQTSKSTELTEAEQRKREWESDSETAAAAIDIATSESTRSQLFLVVKCGDDVSFLELLEGGTWTIGRGSEANVLVDDHRVSRLHATLRLGSGALTIEDLGSRNGTLVNGRVLRRTRVRVGIGDVITLGGSDLVVAARAGQANVVGTPSTDVEPVDVVVADPAMVRIYESVRKVARMPTTVLILGETGTGKDVLAQRLHACSARAEKPFVRVNCAGIPESLLESELYGYERGAFTGADRRKDGYFAAANGGTVFLDEIGELPLSAQVKLLHVLENRTITRLGGTVPSPIDVRVICATHRDLQKLVGEERFRADLYFRVSPFILHIPALRERPSEVPLLANVFLQQLARQVGQPPPTIAPDALAMLIGCRWPGNARELRNAIEHAFVLAEGATLHIHHFAPEVRGLAQPAPATDTPHKMKSEMEAVERERILQALAIEAGNQTRAAARLGMPRRTLVHKLTLYRRRSKDSTRG